MSSARRKNAADVPEKRRRVKRLFFDEAHPDSFTHVRQKRKKDGTSNVPFYVLVKSRTR